MSDVYTKIKITNDYICGVAEDSDANNLGRANQSLIKALRDLVEQIMFALYLKKTKADDDFVPPTRDSSELRRFINGLPKEQKFLHDFHKHLESSASHWMPDEMGALSLSLWYRNWLTLLKKLAKEELDLDILDGIERLFASQPKDLQNYYEQIARALSHPREEGRHVSGDYLIGKKRPVFSGKGIFYEITFETADEPSSKNDRLIVYSPIDLPRHFFYRLELIAETININNYPVQVFILSGCMKFIRKKELNLLRRLFGLTSERFAKNSDFEKTMRFLSDNDYSLLDIASLSEEAFEEVTKECCSLAKNRPVFEMLEVARSFLAQDGPGINLARYALYHPRKAWLTGTVFAGRPNTKLGGLCARNRAIPFDESPYAFHLPDHMTSYSDLIFCIDPTGRDHEFLYRYLSNSTEMGKTMYSSAESLSSFSDLESKASLFNDSLYSSFRDRCSIVKRGSIYFVSGYEKDLDTIFSHVDALRLSGISTFKQYVTSKINDSSFAGYDEAKKKWAIDAFQTTRIRFITGPAGTGKSTVVKLLRTLFPTTSFLCLTHTYAALDNLRAKLSDRSCVFQTIGKFLSRVQSETEPKDYRIVCIDECGVISNEVMAKLFPILRRMNCVVLLIGDPFQIEAIQYGNWFSLATRYFSDLTMELNTPYRTKEKRLKQLWDYVRGGDEKAISLLSAGISKEIDLKDILQRKPDQIILCLNYDGLYGVNNVNRILQTFNTGTSISWRAWLFKVGDPILFKETVRFGDSLYNNLKGIILGVSEDDLKITFTVEVFRSFEPFFFSTEFVLLEKDGVPENHSIVQFDVYKQGLVDDDGENDDSRTYIPFQLAYAVTIHKAQGLEYDTVKIIVTDEIDERITKNIFYTAITRARHELFIYWSNDTCVRTLRQILKKRDDGDIDIYLRHLQQQ